MNQCKLVKYSCGGLVFKCFEFKCFELQIRWLCVQIPTPPICHDLVLEQDP